MKKRLLLLLVSMVLIPLGLAAQTFPVKGTVKDAAGDPVIGATVTVVGNAGIGVVTDVNGNFSINVPSDAKELEIAYLGMLSQRVPAAKNAPINVVLQENSEQLDDVVMVGYGSVKKSDLTGSVGVVKAETIAAKGVTSVLESLQGQVAGVNITQASSRAGEGFNIEIRGKSTLGDQTQPLYVIDGVVCDNMNFLNPMDIEKVDILKDASSTAIYGSRATNGVVMITTKKGTLSATGMKANVSYDGYYGYKTPANMPELMDGYEFMQYRFLRYLTADQKADGTTVWNMSDANFRNVWGASSVAVQDMYRNNDYTDWVPLVTRNGNQQNHFVNVTGGNADLSYRVGMGYQQENGVMYDDYSRWNLKGAVDHNISDKFSTGFSANLAMSTKNNGSQKSVQTGFMMAPIMPAYYWEGENAGLPIPQPAKDAVVYPNGGGPTSTYNPILDRENSTDKTRTINAMANIYFQYNPIKDLSLKTTFSPMYQNAQRGVFYTGQTETRRDKGTNQAEDWNDWVFSYTWDTQANYTKKFGDHTLGILGLISAYQQEWEGNYVNVTDMPFDVQWYNWGAGTLENRTSYYNKITMLSYVARLNYNYKNRYLLTVSSRWDGSSKFVGENRWGIFPSAAFAWRINEEEFMANASDWLSNLKLRLSYGLTGNNAGVGPYDTQALADVKRYYNFGGANAFGYGYNMSNAGLKWETTGETNIGLDFGFFKNRISGSIDLYNRDSKDLLMDMKTPYELGSYSGAVVSNIGRVNNKGIEIMLNTVNVATKDWRWETSFTFAHNKNAIVELNGGSTPGVDDLVGNKWFIGQPIDVIYSYKMIGIVDADRAKEIAADPNMKTKFYEGEMELLDREINGVKDGVINADDKMILGHCSPTWTGSFTSNLSYKNWDLGVNVYTSQGGMVYSQFMREMLRYGSRGTQHIKIDYYIPDGAPLLAEPEDLAYIYNGDATKNVMDIPGMVTYQKGTHNGKYPYPTSTAGNGYGNVLNGVDSEDNPLYCVDNSFVKIKNITLGYTFSKNTLSKIGLEGLRIYANVLNPFVFSSYEGFDPEWADGNFGNGSAGVASRTYQLGVNLKF